MAEQANKKVAETKTTPDVNPITADNFDLNDLYEEHKTKSATIRFLNGKGYERKHIAKFMNIRYQHVRNVLITPLKGDAKSDS